MTQSNELAERWLLDAAIEILPLLPEADRPSLEGLAIHVGAVPGTRGTSKSTLGTYVPGALTEDGKPAIFISPLVADEPTVLATLTHELVHHASVTLYDAAGHGKTFGRIARAIGLDGPLTATTASPALADELAGIVIVLGGYPIAAIQPERIRRKQSTRMLRLTCPRCSNILRGSRKSAVPLCDGYETEEHHAPVRMVREEPEDESQDDDREE